MSSIATVPTASLASYTCLPLPPDHGLGQESPLFAVSVFVASANLIENDKPGGPWYVLMRPEGISETKSGTGSGGRVNSDRRAEGGRIVEVARGVPLLRWIASLKGNTTRGWVRRRRCITSTLPTYLDWPAENDHRGRNVFSPFPQLQCRWYTFLFGGGF